ncbi:MAG: type II toxin-antitoxin system Phd/YefM family antitoxin [Acidimicrobiaceae bacterium]|nr:type II toxin-antitoxin system Phd/YefM family antitoxin [Acidimicrobiaceae bacterium]
MSNYTVEDRTLTSAPLSDVRSRLSEIVEEAASTGSDFVITRHGRPAAVIVGHDEYESMIETLNILSDPEAMAAIAEAEADIAAGELIELD